MTKKIIPGTEETVVYQCDKCDADDIGEPDATFLRYIRSENGIRDTQEVMHFCVDCAIPVSTLLEGFRND